MELDINGKKIELKKGDITEQDTDAIVNAANSSLVLGGGVAGAIRMKGGPSIQEECNRIGGAEVGGAAITTGGRLKARHVIHAVGPMSGEGGEEAKLKNATINSLRVADENGLKSISFPAVSTGIFGYPTDSCAEIMISASIQYLKGDTGLELIMFVLFTFDDYKIFEDTLKKYS